MARMGMTWDYKLCGLRFQVPAGWDCEIYVLFTGRVVKRVRIIDTTEAERQVAVWDSCSTDPHPAPVSGAYTTIEAAEGRGDRTLLIAPLHCGDLTCTDPHGDARRPFEVPPTLGDWFEESGVVERTSHTFTCGSGDAIEIVTVIRDGETSRAPMRTAGLRDYTNTLVQVLIARNAERLGMWRGGGSGAMAYSDQA
jgi:hypothetical protein